MYRVELGKGLHRLRTWLLAGLACAVAVLPVVVLSTSPEAGGGPQFFDLIRRNGLFDPLAAMVLVQPFFLPLATGLLAGDAIAGDATAGTLRYLLIRPVRRKRLVLAKFAGVVTMLTAGLGLLLVVGLTSGAVAFGVRPLPTLSGTVIGVGPGLLRILAAAGYVVLAMSALAAVGLLLSSLTDSGPGATAGTVVVALASQILDTLPSLRAVHPWLLTHEWLAWADLFRSPIAWDRISHGVVLHLGYVAVFLAIAVAAFRQRDITS